MGRPKGKKDSRPRADGRWEGRRTKGAEKAGANSRAPQSQGQPTLAASFERGRAQQSSGGAGASSSGGSQQQGEASTGAGAPDASRPEQEESGREAESDDGDGEEQDGEADGEEQDNAQQAEGGADEGRAEPAEPAEPEPADPGRAADERADDEPRDGYGSFDDEPEEDMLNPDEEPAQRAERRPVGEADIDGDGLRGADMRDSVNFTYVRLVRDRLKKETSSRAKGLAVMPWLLPYLKRNGFLLRADAAPWVMQRLSTDGDGVNVEIAGFQRQYIRDLRVWLPHLQYGHKAVCPTCESSASVGVHDWREGGVPRGEKLGWPARRVTGLREDYFILSCRYICHTCERQHAATKERVGAAAAGVGMRCMDADDDGEDCGDDDEDDEAAPRLVPYVFAGWNARSRELMPFGLGARFPAFITRRRAVDMVRRRPLKPSQVTASAQAHNLKAAAHLTFVLHRAQLLIDLLRPLSEAGVRPERFASILLELATKHHTRRAIEHEQDLRIRRQRDQQIEGEPLSEFGDKKRYAGCVPTGHYFAQVLKAYGRTTRAHMDAEVRWWWGALVGG
jgi:hypothetical protein